MSTYSNKLRQEKRVELSEKVSHSLGLEIWEKSLTTDPTQFADYLMEITDEQAIETFFANFFKEKLHPRGPDGKFAKSTSAAPKSKGLTTKNAGEVDPLAEAEKLRQENLSATKEIATIDHQIEGVKAQQKALSDKLRAEDDALWKEHTDITNTLKDRTPEGKKRLAEIEAKQAELGARHERTYKRYEKLIQDAKDRQTGLKGRMESNRNTIQFYVDSIMKGNKVSKTEVVYPTKKPSGLAPGGPRKALLE